MKRSLILKAPDDWHLHLRDGPLMETVLADACQQFRRALVMPNLTPPIKTTADAQAYAGRIQNAVPPKNRFTAFMALYLTKDLDIDDLLRAQKQAQVVAVKWYPQGVTTNAELGIACGQDIPPALLQAMADHNIIFCVHGESNKKNIDPFDREKVFIETELDPIRRSFPRLKIVFEHITTRHAVRYVRQNKNIAATITAHHLAYNRQALFHGGLRPHWYCLPLLKREEDRVELVEAATSGSSQFFLGTDAAPHDSDQKESSCGCAGCYTTPHAMELYASIFENAGRIKNLEIFSSRMGAAFYEQPDNLEELILEARSWTVPASIALSSGKKLIPLCAGMTFHWKAKMVLP